MIAGFHHASTVRVKTCDLHGRQAVYTLKTDHNYWRSYEMYRCNGEWVLHTIAEPEASPNPNPNLKPNEAL